MTKKRKSDGETACLRILHLSDFHFRLGRKWDQDPVLAGLAESVGELKRDGLEPDVVVFTGDVAFSGKKAEYDKYMETSGGKQMLGQAVVSLSKAALADADVQPAAFLRDFFKTGNSPSGVGSAELSEEDRQKVAAYMKASGAFDLLGADCNANRICDWRDISSGASPDVNGNGIPDECEACPADVNGDGTVDVVDLLILLATWGPCPQWLGAGGLSPSGPW